VRICCRQEQNHKSRAQIRTKIECFHPSIKITLYLSILLEDNPLFYCLYYIERPNMALSSQQSLSIALAAATASKLSWETQREDDCTHLDGFGSYVAADRIPKVLSVTKASPDSTVATDANMSTSSTDTTQDNPEEESISDMSVVFSASFSFGDDAISPDGDSGPEDYLISDSPILSTPKTPKAFTAGSEDSTNKLSTPMVDRALTNIPAPTPSQGYAFSSPARARKRLIEQYALSRSSSNLSPLCVPNLLTLHNSSNLCIPNIGVKSSARRMSAPDIVLRHEAKIDGTVSPERGARRSFLVQRQIEILEKRCSISKTSIQTETCKEDLIVPLLKNLNSDVDSQSAGSQEGDGATADQNNASLAEARAAIEASTTVKTKSKGARSRRNLLVFLSIIFIAGVLSFLHPETLSIVKLNITHFVGVRKAVESVRIVSQAVEDDKTMKEGVDDDSTTEEGVDDDSTTEEGVDDDRTREEGVNDDRTIEEGVDDDRTMDEGVDDDRTMEEGVDDDWIVEKARRKSLMSNCWL
jgi:hypothetical protein